MDQQKKIDFDQNRSIFVANVNTTTNPHNNNTYNARINKPTTIIYHLPATIFFKDFDDVQNKWVKTPLKDIIGNVTRNITAYGYAVIVLHPQDFAKPVSGNENFTNSIVQKEILDLSKLINFFIANNTGITTFDKVVTRSIHFKHV